MRTDGRSAARDRSAARGRPGKAGAAALLVLGLATACPPALASAKEAPVRYEDGEVRLIEVTIAPGAAADMPANPFGSVFAFDRPRDALAVSGGAAAWGEGSAPLAMHLPTCATASSRAGEHIVNRGAAPAHFYRLDLKRLDGDAVKDNWRLWYPWMLAPAKPVKSAPAGDAKPFSPIWPYPPSYDSIRAAPANHLLRYEDADIRVIEVVTRPGETENMHGHPYPSVFAYKAPGLTHMRNAFLAEDDPLNNHGFRNAGAGPAPTGAQYPTCRTLGPEAPHSVTNLEAYPLHFYRIEFKRLPGPAAAAAHAAR